MRGVRSEPRGRQIGDRRGGCGRADLKGLVGQLDKPRAVWVMLPSGAITEDTVTQLGSLLVKAATS